MSNSEVPEPWLSFLKEIDDSLESEVSFHCFGGFAIILQYPLPRETADLDVVAAIVRENSTQLSELAGRDSALHQKHKVYLDLVSVATVPDDYQDRLIPIAATTFKNIRLFVMEAHDIVLSKLVRNAPKDVQDVEFLAGAANLDIGILRDRYQAELRHNMIGPVERADGTLEYWINIINEVQARESSPNA